MFQRNIFISNIIVGFRYVPENVCACRVPGLQLNAVSNCINLDYTSRAFIYVLYKAFRWNAVYICVMSTHKVFLWNTHNIVSSTLDQTYMDSSHMFQRNILWVA